MTSEKSSREMSTSLEFNNVQYDTGDVVAFKDVEGITNPEFPIEITGFHGELVHLKGVDNSWVGSCNIRAITMVEKFQESQPEPTVVMEIGETDHGMTHLSTRYTAQYVFGTTMPCTRCGRTLKAPRSVACGYGPVCYRILFGKEQPVLLKPERSSRVSKIEEWPNVTDVSRWFK